MQVGQIAIENDSKKKSELMDDELDLLPIFTKETNRTRIPGETLEHIDALKNIDQALSRFKLNKNEVRVYLYHARFGAHKAQSIAEALGVHRNRSLQDPTPTRRTGTHHTRHGAPYEVPSSIL